MEALVLDDALPVLADWSRPEWAESTETDENAVIYSRVVCGNPEVAAPNGETPNDDSVTVLLMQRDELQMTQDGAVVRRQPAMLIVNRELTLTVGSGVELAHTLLKMEKMVANHSDR